MRPVVYDHIEALKPYVAGKPISELKRELGIERVIKLASNENPLGPSPKAIAAIQAAASGLHIYPDASSFELKAVASDFYNVPANELTTGNGSNELLTLIARTFCLPGDHAVISDVSFIAYRIIMQAEALRWTSVPLLDGFETDIDAMLNAIEPGKTRVVFLANPNNPTGTYVGTSGLERLLKEVPEDIVVVVDEAYTEYVQADDYTSAMTLRHLRERLIITRTMSKAYGLGGLRVGFGIAPPKMIDYINRVREPFNCSMLAQEGGKAALQDTAFIDRTVSANEAGRIYLEAELARLAPLGISWTPSQTNFLLVHTPHEGKAVFDAMLRHGVIVRPMAGYGLPNHLRVTIGTQDECQWFINAFEQTHHTLNASTESP